MQKKALITGINGQDGYYLKEFLLNKNYQILGLSRTLRNTNDAVEVVQGSVTDEALINKLIEEYQPDEIYNLASQSFPSRSWHMELETTMTNAIGAHIIFKAVRKINPKIKIFQASSSEMYGNVSGEPIDESTPLNPKNPYAVSKCYAHNMGKVYRESYGLFICNGIMFNHESPRRGLHYITQKISYAAACIKMGIKNSNELNEKGDPIVNNGKLALGNLKVKRDWGFAGDYVEAMWLMLQQDKADDYVIGTGKLKSLEELCEITFSHVDLNWQQYIVTDKNLMRKNEIEIILSDPTKANTILAWKSNTGIENLISMMVEKQLSEINKLKI